MDAILINVIIFAIMSHLFFNRIIFYRSKVEAGKFVIRNGRNAFDRKYKSFDKFQDIIMWRRLVASLLILGLTFLIQK